jgi:hypothetical protein
MNLWHPQHAAAIANRRKLKSIIDRTARLQCGAPPVTSTRTSVAFDNGQRDARRRGFEAQTATGGRQAGFSVYA